MLNFYILNDDHSTKVVSNKDWAIYFNQSNRHVRKNVIKKYNVTISTVFLGLDHGYFGKPLIFETMIFCDDPEYNNWMDRYSTWDEALAGHREAVRMIVKILREKNEVKNA